jgi:arginyl-tRNA synthetase
VVLERPRNPEHGDWRATSRWSSRGRCAARRAQIAEELVERIDLAGAGLRRRGRRPRLHQLPPRRRLPRRRASPPRRAGARLRPLRGRRRPRGVVEFVSANPTGPLHIGHGRQAALGDAVAELLAWTGWTAHREFYYNDAGEQIARLTRSVWARYQQHLGATSSSPRTATTASYVTEIARRARGGDGDRYAGDDSPGGARRAAPLRRAELRAEQNRDLDDFRVRFDEFFLESSLYTGGHVEETIRRLRETGLVYEHEGALWLRTTEFGDDKDRVMVKSSGHPTYFLPDVAYHLAKWERGFHRAINVQGADHHGTVARVRAGLQALGLPAGYPEYVLHQMVLVVRGGAEVKFSKRAGDYVTLRDLFDEVGVDVTRYFFLMRRAGGPAHLRPGPGAGPVGQEPGLQGPVRARPHVVDLPPRRRRVRGVHHRRLG